MELVGQQWVTEDNNSKINLNRDIMYTMTQISKAHFSSTGDDIRFSMPIAKIDQERRTVSGFATLDNIDRQGDKLTPESSKEAFSNFRGNVRLMHQPIPAGKVLSFRENTFYDPKTSKTYSGIFVDAYVSKGAEDIWQMVLDGTLTGFSIGGRIMDSEPVVDEESGESIRLVKKYELMELSLVDSPANQFANILSIQKSKDGVTTSGIATEVSVQNIFWCDSDTVAVANKAEDLSCPMCESAMTQIGWIEENDINQIGKVVDSYFSKKMVHVDEEEKIKKRKFVENHPDCKGGVGLVDDDGKLISCFASKEDAEASIFEEDMEMSEKEVITSENTPNRNATQGNRGRVSEIISRRKKKMKRMYKVAAGELSSGDFVAYAVNKDPQPLQYAKGKVESIKTSGMVNVRGTNEKIQATQDNPVAIVRVYRETSGGKFVRTDRMVAKKISNLRKLKPLSIKMRNEDMVKAESSKKTLQDKVNQHNEKYGNVNSKRVTLSMLQQVYNRGIGAYRSNPSSVRPNVASAEQWAFARVNGFLFAVRTGKFKRSPFDTDLLPKGHPLAGKKKEKSDMKKSDSKIEGGVEVAENIEAQEEVLDAAEAPEETEEVEFEVEESVEEVEDADAELVLAKADGEVEEAQAEDTSDAARLEKALGEVKDLVEQAIAKSVSSNTEGINAVSNSVLELEKSMHDKTDQTEKNMHNMEKAMHDMQKSMQDMQKSMTESFASLTSRVESLEEDTAMKKSGELEYSAPEQPVMRKSLWGGRFLNSAEIFN
jgi:uncharacterized protein YoxC